MNKIRDFSIQEFVDFSAKELRDIDDIQLLILKGHILVEYSLNCYLEANAKGENSDFFKERFTFSNKIKIAKHFTILGDRNDNLLKELQLLNKVRNEIAHSLNYSESVLNELISEVKKKSPDRKLYDEMSLKEQFIGAIGFITGALFGGFKFYTNREDLDDFIEEK